MKTTTSNMSIVKCTLVGDGMVGKTAIAQSFVGKHVQEDYVATVFENYAGIATVAGSCHTISIYDPAGQHDYANMRACTYTDCEVILLCYDASKRESFDNIKEFWLPEVRRFRGKKSAIGLVATQTDKRTARPAFVSSEEGEDLAKEINAEGYVETTVFNREGIRTLFEKTAIWALKYRKRTSNIFSRLLRQ